MPSSAPTLKILWKSACLCDICTLSDLKQLESENRLVLAGPHPVTDESEPEQPAFSGSLVVAEFESLNAAEQWAQADPYVDAGVYAQVVVKPFLKVLPSATS